MPRPLNRHLTRSRYSFLFHIRIPAELDPARPLVSISLQTCSRAKASRLTASLAARAQVFFDNAVDQPLTCAEKLIDCADGRHDVLAGQSISAVELRSFLEAALTLSREADEAELQAANAVASGKPLGLPRGNCVSASPQPDLVKAAERYADNAPLGLDARVERYDAMGAAAGTLVSGVTCRAIAPEVGLVACETDPKRSTASRDDKKGVSPPPYPLTNAQEQRIESDVPDYLLDRRTVVRAPSKLPRFSRIAEDYLELRTVATPDRLKDIKSARSRIAVFIGLVGDHPVDRYEASDLQAFVLLMGDWPAKPTQRREISPWVVLERSKCSGHRTIAQKSLKDGYVATIRAAMRWGTTAHLYKDPFKDVPLRYPSGLSTSRETLPLSAKQLSAVFRLGVHSGHMDQAMLPLLGHLTGRRLSVLIHLRGCDIIQQFQDIWVAQPKSLLRVDGRVRRVPIKTKSSAKFFVLHDFLYRIGFIDWAVSRGNHFLFPELMRLNDPSKTASQYMKRLFIRAGIPPRSGEVFHSLRGEYIEELRDHQISTRTAKLQVGHSLGQDVHARYGSKSIREVSARALAHIPMRSDVDYSIFEGLDFQRMARNARKKGVRGGVELPLDHDQYKAFDDQEDRIPDK